MSGPVKLALISAAGSTTRTPQAAGTPAERTRRLERAVWEARDELLDALRQDTLMLPPDVRERLWTLAERAAHAGRRLEAYHERRAEQFATSLRKVVNSGAVTDAQLRLKILEAVDGPGAAAREPTLLAPTEGTLLEAYRRLGPEMQAAMRAHMKACAKHVGRGGSPSPDPPGAAS